MEEKKGAEVLPLLPAGEQFWQTCQVNNLPLKGFIYPFFFSQPIITSRGASPKTYIFRSMPFARAVAAASAMR